MCLVPVSISITNTVCPLALSIKQKCELCKGHDEFIFTFSNGPPFLLKPIGCGLQSVASDKHVGQKTVKALCADMLQVTLFHL